MRVGTPEWLVKPWLGAARLRTSHPLRKGLLFYCLFHEGTGEANALWPQGARGITGGTGGFKGWRVYPGGGLSRNWAYNNLDDPGTKQYVYWPKIFATKPSNPTIMCSAWPSTSAGFVMGLLEAGAINMSLYANFQLGYQAFAPGSYGGSYTLPGGATFGDPSQLAVSWAPARPSDGAADMRVWINGKRISDDTFGSAYGNLDWTHGVGTDLYVSGTGGSMQGPIYWVAAWDRVLLDDEVAWLYRSPYTMLEPPGLEIRKSVLGLILGRSGSDQPFLQERQGRNVEILRG